MKLVLFLIGRLFVIALGLLVALIAASLFIGFGLASSIFAAGPADGGPVLFGPEFDQVLVTAGTFIFGVFTSFKLASLAVLPVTIAVAVSEMMRWRSLTIHLVLGGVCGLFVMFSALSLPQGELPENGTVIVSLAAGFVAAFFYWLIAGRNAGEWLSALGQEYADREGGEYPGEHPVNDAGDARVPAQGVGKPVNRNDQEN